MISQLRPLGISLLLHAFLLGLFLFWLTSDKPKKIPHPLKIHISAYTPSETSSKLITPHTTSVPQHRQILPAIVPVTQPVTPSHAATRVSTPTPDTPAIVPSKPAAVIQATPVVETPKPSSIVTPTLSPPINIEKEFINAHLGEIRALLIQNLKYPRNAQRLKMQGEVRVSFRLKSDGSVDNIEVTQSSGFEILDEDAKALIKNTAPQFPKPTKSISLSVPLAYLLR